jgi:hypothetical protein
MRPRVIVVMNIILEKLIKMLLTPPPFLKEMSGRPQLLPPDG